MRLTSDDVAAEAGCSYRQLDYWIKQGYLSPRFAVTGQGSVREFDDDEMQVACRMVRLIRAGMKPGQAAKIARDLMTLTVVEIGEGFRLHDTHDTTTGDDAA